MLQYITMKIINTTAELRSELSTQSSIALVPTMGNLHAGIPSGKNRKATCPMRRSQHIRQPATIWRE